MNSRRTAVLLVVWFALTGCAAIQNSGRVKDGPGIDFSAAELKEYRTNQDAVLAELAALARDPQSQQAPNWDAVIAAGMDYADSKCEAYLHALFRLNRDRKTATTQIGLLGSAAAGLMAAAESAARDVAMVAIAFGLAGSSVDNLSSNLLYDLDPSSVRTLVKSLQAAYRQGVPTGYSSRPAAFSVIRGYAALCLPTSIEAEVNLAVKKAQPSAESGDAAKGRPPAVSNSETAAGNFSVKVDDNTAILRNFVFPGGTLNPQNRQRLEEFIRSKNITADVSSFMRLEKYAAERAEAVSRLNLK